MSRRIQLDERDWLMLLNAVRELHTHPDPSRLTAAMVDVVRRIVPCEYASYDEVDLVERTTGGLCSDPAIDRQWPSVQDAAAAHFNEHPVLHFFKSHPHAGARRISDFLSDSRFQALGLYQDCYRYLGVNHQMVVRLPGKSTVEVGLALNREGSDFTERDRLCLNLLRPHLQQAYERSLQYARQGEMVVGAMSVLESLPQGVIVVDGSDRMIVCTSRAREQMTRYFDSDWAKSDRLPRALAHWLNALRQPEVNGLIAANPWRVNQGRSNLTITANLDADNQRWVICIEEYDVDAALARLRDLGITPRQAQVLYWVAQGKTNPEVAQILAMSSRTVQKHLENIFRVLHVETRTMAARKAIEVMTMSASDVGIG